MSRILPAALALVACLASTSFAQDDQPSELEKLRKEFEDFKKQFQPQEGLRKKAAEEAARKPGGIYTKPFLLDSEGRMYVSGYMDIEYINTEKSKSDTFDQHRFVPFFYADISDNMKLAAEVEIEHGGEVGVEFATLDYWMSDGFNLRAGIILLPLGKFNLVHDAPFQDLTRRPMVDTYILPAVLRDPGIGFFGSADLDPWLIDYEIYVTNGFKGLSNDGMTAISTSKGLRDARPHDDKLGDATKKYRDFNDNKAVTARISVSPALGLEFGFSFHTGAYDERGDNDLTITAFDATIHGGALSEDLHAFELVFEIADAEVDRDAFALGSGIAGDMDGWFVELRAHFMVAPGVFEVSDESTFTFVVRRGSIDLDGAEMDRTTFGLNYRPTEGSVFKLEVEKNRESGSLTESDDDAVLFSIASYF